MINLSNEELRTLQHIELEMLVEVDRICRKNHIHYSITGGTLLGAVRHGGFIPWDDDADISMLRSEYVRFRKACETDLDKDRFYFQDMDNTEGYRWGYGKVRRKDSLFLREYQENMPYEQGIFIDIFPRDGIPEGSMAGRIHSLLCFFIRKAFWSAIGKEMAGNRFIRDVYAVIAKIPLASLRRSYRNLVRWSNERPRKQVRALTFPLPRGVRGYDRKWYGRYTNIEFEGHKLMVESSYLDWLKREFGNYMTIPPKEKQKVHPVSAIKFPKEYLI